MPIIRIETNVEQTKIALGLQTLIVQSLVKVMKDKDQNVIQFYAKQNFKNV